MNGYAEVECLRTYNYLIVKYNNLFNINLYLKRANERLQLSIRTNKKLFEGRKNSIFEALQTRIERENYHLKQIERLKCKLCSKARDISMLKHLNDEQIEQFQKELELIIGKYQNQFCKNENVCKCSLSSEFESEQLSVDSENSCEDKSLVDSKCSSEYHLKVNSKCSCEDKLNEDSKCPCEDKLKEDLKCLSEDKFPIDSKYASEDKLEVDSKCPCEDKLLLDNSVEHVSEGQLYGDIQELLLAIDEYCNSKTLCNSILTLLKQSKSNICSLIEDNEISRNELTQCQSDLACYTNKLNKEIDLSKKKDSEILSMYSDLTLMADELKKISKEKSNLENQLNQLNDELHSKAVDCEQLVNQFEEQQDKLSSIKSCSNVKICDDEFILREVCEKTHTLTDNITIIDGLEHDLREMKKQLKETEQLNINFQDKCKLLNVENVDLKDKLDIETNNNIKNCIKIEEFSKRINKFEAVTKGLEIQNKTHIVKIDELKQEKCDEEKKFNKIIEDIYCTVQELRKELATAKLDTENTEKILKNINDEDKKCFENKIGLLKIDIENLETELSHYKCQHDLLMTKYLVNEKELSKSIEMVKLLQTRELELNKENEESKEQLLTLCRDVNMMKQQLEETIQKNNELTHHNNNLRAENDVQSQDIDELNSELISVRKKESCVRKDLVVYKEKLTKADKEISNLNSEMSSVKCELHKTCANLDCTEKKLQDTELKLNDEIFLKEQITQKYCNMVNCLTTNCEMQQSIKPNCVSAGCQYEISADDKQIGDYCCFPSEETTSCNVTNYDAMGINYENTYSIKISKESTHIGVQTNLCCPENCPPIAHCKTVSVIIEESCPNDNILCCPEPCDANKCDFGQCESNDSCKCQCETPPLETTSQLGSHHSADCLRSDESKLTTTCDCIANFMEKENLKCQLDESKQLLEQYGQDAEKKISEIQAEHCKKEMEMNECFDKVTSQYKTDMDEVTARLKACTETVLYKEKELKCCRERENRLKKEIEKLNEAIKCKDSKICDEENKLKTMCECLEACKTQFVTLKSSLETDKSTKVELEKQMEKLDVKHQNKNLKKLKTPERDVVKQRKSGGPVRKKTSKYIPHEEKTVIISCEEKRMRSGADYGTGHNFRGTEQEMYGRRRGRRYINHTRNGGHNYQSQIRPDTRGFDNGDPAVHTLPAEFIESLRQQVRKNVGCDNTNCYAMGCCSKLYFRR